MKRYQIVFFAALFLIAAGCRSLPADVSGGTPPGESSGEEAELPPGLALPPPGAELPVSSFGEIWAYLVSGREDALDSGGPVSDLCYFGADVDSYGKLVNLPDFGNVAAFPGRLHLVAACSGMALTHFVLAEGSREREELVRDLLEAAKPYHGLQIDFENVPPRDGENFLSFLRELRAGLGDKVFSVALRARTSTLQDDAYDYTKVTPLVDRVIVMAYDEHWSTSEPGPIASMGWCQQVAQYALEIVGREKLVMGLPFYGRSWGSANFNRAYIHSGIEEMLREREIGAIRREQGVPMFTFDAPVSVTVYYEDDYSLSARLEMYRTMGVSAVGFWRLGQETPAFWPRISRERDGNGPAPQ